MTSFLLAFFLFHAGCAFDLSKFDSQESMRDYAKTIQEKSTESEQDILKTLLLERAHWHPEASSLLEEVEKRDAHSWRRLNGTQVRRLAGTQIEGMFYCDGGTKAECEAQQDAQCNTCVWDYDCKIHRCQDYNNQQTCCANAGKVITGCRWQKSMYNAGVMECAPNTCEKLIDEAGMTNAQKKTACDAAPGCTTLCTESTQKIRCYPGKAADYNCMCDLGSCSLKKPKAEAPTDASGRPSCTLMNCAKCMDGKKCSDKKEAGKTGGSCNQYCSGMVTTEAATECVYCGPKKSASCTPKHATPGPSCTAPTTTATTTSGCMASCSATAARCTSGYTSAGCMDTNAPSAAQQGAAISIGAAILAMTAFTLQ